MDMKMDVELVSSVVALKEVKLVHSLVVLMVEQMDFG
jgi:hypothetical protein